MSLTLMLAEAPAPALEEELVKESFTLLLFVALLGVILITGLTLLLVLRRNRLARARKLPKPAEPTPDPWSEAGRRATAENEDPDPSGLGPPVG